MSNDVGMPQKRKIKILRIIARMNVGGPAIQVTNLMIHLPKSNFEQVLATGYCGKNEKDYLEGKDFDFEVTRIGGLRRKISLVRDIQAFLELRKLIREFKPEIIHTHTTKAGFLGRLAARSSFQKVLVVHTFHGHLLNGYFSPRKTKLLIVAEKILAYMTDVIISVGEQVRNDLINVGIAPLGKFRVIPPGFEMEIPIPQTKRELFGFNDSNFVVIWIGRMTQIKAPQRVIEIAKCLIGESIRFVMVGGGEMLPEIEAEIQRSFLPIKILGWREDIASLLQSSDVLLITSKNEGTPISIIEAQKIGKPVVSTKVGSVEEVLIPGKSGYTLDYSPEEFASKIRNLSSNSGLYHSFTMDAKENSLKKFSLSRFIEDHSLLYREISS